MNIIAGGDVSMERLIICFSERANEWTKRVAALLLCLFVLAYASSANAQSRLPITVSNTALPAATLTDYTVRLDLNATNAPGFDFTNNGDDIIAWNSDTTAQLDFYVEDVDSASQTAVVWVRLPSVPPSPPTTQFFLDYNRTDVTTPLSSAPDTFVNQGFKYHSQPHTSAAPGPESRAAAEAEFNFDEVTSNPNYGCTNLTEIMDDHSGVFTENGDFGLSISTQVVVPADALYEFRLGADFGSGGELYIDGNALEADWTDDLWWALSFGNPDVLQGSTLLTAGSHTLRALGYERCCDGRAELEYRYDSDGDGSLADETFSLLTTTSPGLTLLAPSCPTADVVIGPVTTVPVTLAKFSSAKIGPFIKLNWETADETFNAGFNIWSLLQDGHGQDGTQESLVRLNKHLLRSRHIDSMETEHYRWRYNHKGKQPLTNVVISSVDINGVEEFFGPFDIGETYGESFQSQPIDWAKVSKEYEQTMRARGFTKINNRWKKQRSAQQSSESLPSLQVGIKTTGMYRLTYADLISQGIDWNGVRHNDIAVSLDGKAIPRVIRSAKRGVFGKGSSIDFVGVAPDAALSIYQDQRFYQISRAPELVLPIRMIKRKPSSVQSWHYQRQELALDNQHVIFSPLSSPWVMDLIFRTEQPASKEYTFELPEVLADQSGELDFYLGGIANAPLQDFDDDGRLDPHHIISMQVNGQLVNTLSFDGQQERSAVVTLPAGLLRAGDNSVTITVQNSGYDFDAIVVDSLALNYPVANSKAASIEFTAADALDGSAQSSEFDGISIMPQRRRGFIAYAYREDHNAVRIKPYRSTLEKGALDIAFSAAGESRYFIGSESALRKPETMEALAVPAAINLLDSDLLIISHPNFIGPALEEFAQARGLQGVQSSIISTDDIADQFGRDVPLHIAIQRFLKAADQEINYKYVLIVGGHTFDYLGRQNADNINFIPTFYTSIGTSRFTPSDQPFVDFDGDGFPEKAIGRWPVRELSQVATIANKSIAWASKEAERTQQGHGVLLLGDKTREADFAADLDAHFARLTDITIANVERVYVDDISADPAVPASELNKTVQQRVLDGFANNNSWVFYNGHASPNAWSFTQMLAASQVPTLGNDAPVLITSLGCYTTYYESPSHNSLALQLMFSGANAAVAIHGPSVVGGYNNQRRLSDFIADQMKSGQTLGESIRLGMRTLPVNYRTAISNWALLGDPSLPVQ